MMLRLSLKVQFRKVGDQMTSPIHINDQGGTQAFSAALKSISNDYTPANVQAVVCGLTEDECRMLQALVFEIDNNLHDRVRVFDKEFLYDPK